MLNFRITATKEWQELLADVVKTSKERYLCGYSLHELFEQSAIARLALLAGHNFCYELAALAMFTVPNNHTARIISGSAEVKCEDGSFYDVDDHYVVELDHSGQTYILDFAWAAGVPIPIDAYCDVIDFAPRGTIHNLLFWTRREVWKFLECSMLPDTSNILVELRQYLCPEPAQADEYGFCRGMKLSENTGKIFLPYFNKDGETITKEAVDRIMRPWSRSQRLAG